MQEVISSQEIQSVDSPLVAKTRAKKPAVTGETMVMINLGKGEGDDEKDAQYVGINGIKDYLVPRGINTEVPESVYEVLANAKRPQLNEDGSGTFEVSRFAINVLGRRTVQVAAAA